MTDLAHSAMKLALENLRSVIFTGRAISEQQAPMTHEEYVEAYETREDRDPVAEFKAIEEAAAPLVPLFHQKQESIRQFERMISGDSVVDKTEEDDENQDFVKNEDVEGLYEEIITVDTEEQWQKFVKLFLGE